MQIITGLVHGSGIEAKQIAEIQGQQECRQLLMPQNGRSYQAGTVRPSTVIQAH